MTTNLQTRLEREEEAVRERAEASKSKLIGEFIDYEHSDAPKLDEKICTKMIRYSEKRLKKSNCLDLFSEPAEISRKVGWLLHSEVQIGDFLGQGSFSSVYEIKALNVPAGRRQTKLDPAQCVVKVLRTKLLDSPAMLAACAADLAKEGFLMAYLEHQHVMNVRAWTPTGLQGLETGRHDAFFLVLDKLEDTLSNRLKQWQKHSNRLKFRLTMQRNVKKTNFLNDRLQVALHVANAVEYLHQHNILHRDLKPDNIGFDCQGILKVFDFDVARILPEGKPNDTFLLTKKVGSPRYMSPECARGEPYNLKADVYTFALLLHELMSLEKPYDDINAEDHDEMVFQRGVRPYLPPSWPVSIQTLLKQCWSEDFSDRPTIEQVHKILVQQIPLIIAEKEIKYSSKPWSRNRTKRLGIPVDGVVVRVRA
jgi:serine/threonine protein kinase